MSDTKIQCNSCGAKFFTLNREVIQCKCGHQIIVKEHLHNINNNLKKYPNENENKDINFELDDKDNFLDEEDSLL